LYKVEVKAEKKTTKVEVKAEAELFS